VCARHPDHRLDHLQHRAHGAGVVLLGPAGLGRPAQYFALQVCSGVVSAASFSLSPNGTFVIDPSATSLLSLDAFHGLRRLNVIAPL
jgi:hypothetical protein